MVSLRQDVERPNCSHLVQAKAYRIAMVGEVLVQQGWHVHLFQLGQQQRESSTHSLMMFSLSAMPRVNHNVKPPQL